MKTFWKIMLVIFVLAGGGLYWWKTQSGSRPPEAGKSAKAEGKAPGKRGGGGPVSVRTVAVERKPMPVIIDVVGTVESEHSVAVRPQVNGVLEAVLFKEGDYVKGGQALFRIDPRPTKAAVEQARAAVTRDQAQLAQAQAQEARLRPLMEKDYITKQEYDVAATQAKSLEATVNQNRAALDQAQLQLSYAQISAPIAGRTGSLSVKSGNLVTGGTGGAPLVVINSTRPILVSLSVPQRQFEEVRRYWNTPDLKVLVSPGPGSPAVTEGQLIFIDNTVNPQTGTITLKARVKNEQEELWPGQFVAARIVLRIEKDALVLPEGAVQPGQDRPFVYVVRDGKAAIRPVEIARQVGDKVVIASGVNEGDQVVVDVPLALTDGATIRLREAGVPKDEGKSGAGKGRKDAPANETSPKEASAKELAGK